MKYSKYKKAEIAKLKRKVFELYKQGISARDISDLHIKNERSYTWILDAVKELEKAEE
jgi:transposase-like protein